MSVRAFILFLFNQLPVSSWFAMNRWLLARAGLSIGKEVRVLSTTRFRTAGAISIGDETWIGDEVMIIGGAAEVRIGAKCDLAPRVTIVTGTHKIIAGQDKAAGEGYSEPVVIGNGCWIGAGATLLHGTEIGECSVVAAGAVAKGKYPPRVILAGVPATIKSSIG